MSVTGVTARLKSLRQLHVTTESFGVFAGSFSAVVIPAVAIQPTF